MVVGLTVSKTSESALCRTVSDRRPYWDVRMSKGYDVHDSACFERGVLIAVVCGMGVLG